MLEHVVGVAKVLENFATWIRPGGLLILRLPDADSVYGFLARHTPHWTHVAVKKYIYKMENAGKPGHDPYPVVYEPAMTYSGITQFCECRGFTLSATASAGYLNRRSWIKPLVIAISWLSLGRLAWRHDNLTLVIADSRCRQE